MTEQLEYCVNKLWLRISIKVYFFIPPTRSSYEVVLLVKSILSFQLNHVITVPYMLQ